MSEDVAPPRPAVAAMVFRLVLPGSSVSSDPIGDGSSGVVGLGALSSVKALSSPSVSDERSVSPLEGRCGFRCWSPFCLFVRCCWLTQPDVTIRSPSGDACSR